MATLCIHSSELEIMIEGTNTTTSKSMSQSFTPSESDIFTKILTKNEIKTF
jgi:hypothetical protein